MSDGVEYRLKIEAYTPDTIPMERLAEYLAELAQMIGERTSVHFVRLDTGSTSVIHRIDREAIPKVTSRTASVRRGIGPRDSVRAYRRINRMLRDDNGSAVWKEEKTEVPIIVFPGKDDAVEQVTGIAQRGSIDGEVIRVGGLQNIVPITLKCEQEEIFGCWANKHVAKSIGRRLFDPVRLFGRGRWNRSGEGQWKLDIFRVESFEPLRDVPLSKALNELRAIQTEWDHASFAELRFIRSGQIERANGDP